MSQATSDPDRFLDFRGPGAQEWWYFDSLSDDGRDGLVLVWYAALPFDPKYGRAALRHLKSSGRHPAPHPLDHCAIGISWYRLGGSTIRRIAPGNPGPIAQAYALNSYRREAFSHGAEPFSVNVAGNLLERDERGYRLRVDTPDLSKRHRIVADLRFDPTPGTEPFERDLGGDGSPHLWMLAAPDCRVTGRLAVEGPGGLEVTYSGRGYHDHNAGAEELSHSMDRWEWGRVHHGSRTEIFYVSRPRRGPTQALWISCDEGRAVAVREEARISRHSPRRNPFGLRYDRAMILEEPGAERSLARWNNRSVDAGPFYQRWVADFTGLDGPEGGTYPGITELLDGRRLHHPLFSWMVPFRLKRPV